LCRNANANISVLVFVREIPRCIHYLIAWTYNLDADSVTENRIGSGAKTGRLKQHYNPVKLYFLPGNGEEKQLLGCATSCQQPDICRA